MKQNCKMQIQSRIHPCLRESKQRAEPQTGASSQTNYFQPRSNMVGESLLVALAEHAVRFRNIYFPLTASDSLPGRPRHDEQVDLASTFVCEIRDRSPTSSTRVFHSEFAGGGCVYVCMCHEQCSLVFSIFKKKKS